MKALRTTVFSASVLLFLAFIAYSGFVALHEPDPQETVILGQSQIAAGSPAALRILVRNRASGDPIRNADVRLQLTGTNTAPKPLGIFKTDTSGTIDATFDVPQLAPGEYDLVIETTSRIGRDVIVRKVDVQSPTRILLSSDKPLYQPGQTIRLRTVVLNSRNQKPFANEPVTFEVSDPKGNKVFKETRRTSAFGIASADFALASELNLGAYQVRAVSGKAEAERAIEVKRYTLPKFKIQLTTDKAYFLPGESISGRLVASYFFGRPVAGANVKVTAPNLGSIGGQTDSTGSFRFQLPLAASGEAGRLELTAEVRDSAGHTQEKTVALSIAKHDLELAVIPEAGALLPGVENILYVVAEHADGAPAECRIFVDGREHQTDAQGICEIKVTPTKADQQFEIVAQDQNNRRRQTFFRGETNSAPFLVRPDKAIYNAGETARVSILSPETRGAVFLDVIKDGQTVLTKSVPVDGRKGDFALSLPESLVGILKLHAYIITPTGEDRGASRLICVNPASSLNIAATLSQPTYRPGENARLNIAVTDSTGKPAAAALGIAAVDESLFALRENRINLIDTQLQPRQGLQSLASLQKSLLSGNQTLAAACLASLQEPKRGLTVDELIERGDLSPKIVEHARSMRGTPAYAKLRAMPEYAEAFRLVEGGDTLYSFREATGPGKFQLVEARRKAYFANVRRIAGGACIVALLILPIILLIQSSRLRPSAGAGCDIGGFLTVANSLQRVLAALTLLPLVLYSVGVIAMESTGIGRGLDEPGWPLLAIEVIIVMLALFVQLLRTAPSPRSACTPQIADLRPFIWGFLAQFALSRAVITMAVAYPADWDAVLLVWGLGSIIAPLVVVGALGSRIKYECETFRVELPAGLSTFVQCVVGFALLFILAGMMLPALAKSKARAQSIKFVNDLKNISLAKRIADEDNPSESPADPQGPRIRRHFPETLFWQPEVITDDHGKAMIEIPLADSITTWRASIDAVSSAGRLGAAETPITVFQDFFVDLDLPVSLSLEDQVSVPATCYNYLNEPQEVRLTLAPANWFESAATEFALRLEPNEIKSVSLPLKVSRVGNHILQVTARGSKMSDAIEREIRVLPTGEKIERTINETLRDSFAATFELPAAAIANSQSLWLKFYPSRFSEVVEGLDSIFHAPYGCFEQTSSTTYPNVLVLDYMKRTARLSPEIERKARKYINDGYQRLLTFEVDGGGFEWFGSPPANVCLTAYGVLEFTDMARVHPVDPAIIHRARKWLFSQQSADGSWNEGKRGWTWSGPSSITAFTAWALAESGDRSPQLDRALSYLRANPADITDTYAKALAANAFLARDRTDAFGLELARQLNDSAIRGTNGAIHWTSRGYSVTCSRGSGMAIETTALCAMALMKSGKWPQTVKQALTWISRSKFANGTLGSTQATILAMRALLTASETSLGQDFDSQITVTLNGQAIETIGVTKENSDVVKLIDLTKFLHPGENQIALKQSPAGELPFQLAGAYWLPQPTRSKTESPLELAVTYDRTTLALDEQLRCAVTAKNNSATAVNMPIVDLAIPPGFDVDTSAFVQLKNRGEIEKFEASPTQVVLYLRQLASDAPLSFSYTLHAKFPLQVESPASALYEYYQPENRAHSKPITLHAQTQ